MNRVVVGSKSGAITVYNAKSGSTVCKIRDAGPSVHSVAFHPDSNLILASFNAEEDCKVCRAATFTADTGATVWEHSSESPVFFAAPISTMLSYKVPVKNGYND